MARIRYRLWINSEGIINYHEDTPQGKQHAIYNGAQLFSTSSFYLSFSQGFTIDAIVGDLHLIFDTHHHYSSIDDAGENLQGKAFYEAKEKLQIFFEDYGIPRNLPKYYLCPNFLHVIIPEEALGKTQNNLGLKRNLWQELGCAQNSIIRRKVGNLRTIFYYDNGSLPLIQGKLRLVQLPPEYFWEEDILDYPKKFNKIQAIKTTTSYLASLFHPECKANENRLSLCPVLYEGARHLNSLSGADITTLLGALGYKKHYLGWLVSLTGIDQHTQKTAWKRIEGTISGPSTPLRLFPTLCSDIAEALNKTNSQLRCKGNCGVTTPLALLFREPYFIDEFNQKNRGLSPSPFRVTADGVYKTPSSGQKRELILSRPLWISYGIKGGLGQGNGFQLAFYNAVGSYCEVTIANDSILGPALFKVLEQHGLEIPKSPKCRSMLREYIKTIRVKLLCDATMVSSCGWQQVPSGITVFVLPSTSYSSRSPDFRYIAPTKCLPEFGTHAPNTAKTTYSPRVRITASSMLAKTASFAAPLLRILKLRGFCLYFYSDNANERQNILKAAAAVWEKSYGSVTYTLPISAKNIPELKRIHRDSAICLDLPDSEHEGNFLAFVRRFLHGRKGKDGKECGVIIAVGKRPLKSASDTVGRCQIVSSQSGKRGPRDVLVLSMPYNDNDPDLTLSQVQTHGESLLRALVSFSKDDENTLRNRFKKIQDECRPKGCSNNVKKAVAIFSLSLHSLQRYPQLFVSKILGYNTGMADKVMNLLLSDMLDPHEHFKKYLHNLHARQSTAYLLPSKKHLFLYPTKLFHNCCDTAHQKAFVHFLLTWNILVCKKRGQTSSVVHISEKAKSVRGYLISIQKLEEQLLKIDPQSYRQQYIDRLQRAKVARVKQKEDNTADKRK